MLAGVALGTHRRTRIGKLTGGGLTHKPGGPESRDLSVCQSGNLGRLGIRTIDADDRG